MKLRRIEAVRFGGLRDVSLGELGDGLTIVHGPNEAGKSTLNALVRHVLYGFPTAREKDASYQPSGDTRLGRLVFEGESGRWVIERSEGPRRGDVAVRAIAGAERAALLDEVTRGVSETAFRIVFGFGMDELARIEERGSGDDIISRLYAASAGLAVSPHEVRIALERQADDVFKKGARKRELNELVAELRATRASIRELKLRSESFQADQQRRRDLDARLVEARTARDEARSQAVELALAAQQAAERHRTVVEQEETLRALRLERRQCEDERAAIEVDGALLDRAHELDAMLEEASAFSAGCESYKAAEANVAKAQARATDATARTGLSDETLHALARDHGLASAVDESREDLQRYQLQVEARREEAQRAAAAADAAEATLDRLLTPHGIPVSSAEEAVAERLAAIDALEALRGSNGVGLRSGTDAPAFIMLVSGLAAAVAGIALREWVSLGIGALLAVAAIVLLLRSRRGVPAMPIANERPYLQMLGLGGEAGALDISRARRSLESVRVAVLSAAESRRIADEAGRDALLAQQSCDARRALWAEWLESHGLPGTATPAAVAQLLVLAREASTAQAALAEAQAEASRIAERLDGFAERLGAVAAHATGDQHHLTRDDVPATINRLKERLSSARAAAARVAELGKELQGLDSRIASEAERSSVAGQDLRAILEQHGLAEGTHDDLSRLATQAQRVAEGAAELFDALAGEKNQLEGRLAGDGHERRGTELRLDEAGLQERLADALDRHLVLSAAVKLLSDTLERYERERQPEVVKRAEALFTRITDGRYVGLSVPLTDSPIEVFDTRSGSKTSDILSLGASQQLYLALRLGLIAQLGDVGAGLPVLMDDVFAHFDRERRHGAAEAVAELARLRQVVFFTCHPEVAELLAEVAPDHARIDLQRCD